MLLGKKALIFISLITMVLFLAACGGKDSATKMGGEQETQNHVQGEEKSQDSVEEAFMPISEGFEKYRVWIQTDVYPERQTYFNGVYVFENGELTAYSNFKDHYMREIIDLTDEEIVELAKKDAHTVFKGKYHVDLSLDGTGQYTEKVNVVLEPGYTETTIKDFPYPDEYTSKGFSSVKEYAKAYAEANKENDYNGKVQEVGDDYVSYEKTEEKPEYIINGMLTDAVYQKLLDKTYAGLSTEYDESILTRVEDTFAGFEADYPNTNKDNVTIEGK